MFSSVPRIAGLLAATSLALASLATAAHAQTGALGRPDATNVQMVSVPETYCRSIDNTDMTGQDYYFSDADVTAKSGKVIQSHNGGSCCTADAPWNGSACQAVPTCTNDKDLVGWSCVATEASCARVGLTLIGGVCVTAGPPTCNFNVTASSPLYSVSSTAGGGYTPRLIVNRYTPVSIAGIEPSLISSYFDGGENPGGTYVNNIENHRVVYRASLSWADEIRAALHVDTGGTRTDGTVVTSGLYYPDWSTSGWMQYTYEINIKSKSLISHASHYVELLLQDTTVGVEYEIFVNGTQAGARIFNHGYGYPPPPSYRNSILGLLKDGVNTVKIKHKNVLFQPLPEVVQRSSPYISIYLYGKPCTNI